MTERRFKIDAYVAHAEIAGVLPKVPRVITSDTTSHIVRGENLVEEIRKTRIHGKGENFGSQLSTVLSEGGIEHTIEYTPPLEEK